MFSQSRVSNGIEDSATDDTEHRTQDTGKGKTRKGRRMGGGREGKGGRREEMGGIPGGDVAVDNWADVTQVAAS